MKVVDRKTEELKLNLLNRASDYKSLNVRFFSLKNEKAYPSIKVIKLT